jgi:nucleoside-diphosphate-sugar epimerase
MLETVLVVGATGMLGEPVARRLAADGHSVRVISWMPGRGLLRNVGLPIMQYFTKVEEIGSPSEANALLGAPATTVRAWSEAQRH